MSQEAARPERGGGRKTDISAESVIAARGVSPRSLAYVVGPIALVVLLILRHFGLVAQVPVWAYVCGILGVQVLSWLVEPWSGAPLGSARFHLRVMAHVAGVTSVVYMSGWGPALGMAFAFSALADIEQSGARAWRAALGWSLTGCALGQLLILDGRIPSFLNQSQAQTIGFLGAFVFAIAIRMAGAIGEAKERADELLAEQTKQAAEARDQAQRSEAHHRAVIDHAAEGILTIDPDGSISSFNAAAETMFGWPGCEIVGQPATILVLPELYDAFAEFLASYQSIGEAAANRRDVESTGVRRDGTGFPMMVSTSAVAVDGVAPTISGIIRDLSDQKRFEEQLAHQVLHDPLTGLPNRVMLTDRLEQAIARVRRHHRMFGVLFVDLDRFKSVNDTLGHTVGDQLLIEAATRIQAAVRETDTVARWAGDEFVVLCEDVESVHDATTIAQHIISALHAPFRFGEVDAFVGASIGLALSADGDLTADAILANADIAMYRAKENGRSRYELFDEAMQEWVTTQTALEAALREATPRHQLRLHYQPIIQADTGLIRGVEALVRWERPGFGLVAPHEFIPAAEDSGLIVEIGAWVLGEACQQAAIWARRWPERRLGIAVNVSARQLQSRDIVALVADILARTQLDPTLLTLELTESTLVGDALGARALLEELQDFGINLSLDDFGTGYSSLTYLRAFPIDIVKIDKSFIRTIVTEPDDTAIVSAVIALARSLGISVVAEGVETAEQLAVLLQLQCPYVQGYLFSRPRPSNEIAELVEGRPLRLAASSTRDRGLR